MTFDEPALAVHVAATPEPSGGLLRQLIAGVSPRELIGSGRVSADLVASVLGDAARHGALRAVVWTDGTDALPAAVARELATMKGEISSPGPVEPNDPLVDQALAEGMAGEQDARSADAEDLATEEEGSGPVPLSETKESLDADELGPAEADLAVDASAASLIVDRDFDASEDDEHDPPAPSPAPSTSLEAGPLGRVSRPPPGAPSLHSTPMLASAVEVSQGARHFTPILTTAVEDHQPRLAALDEREAPTEAGRRHQDVPAESRTESRDPAPAEEAKSPEPEAIEPPKVPRFPMPSAWATRPGDQPRGRRRGSRYTLPLIFGLIGIVLAVGARWLRERPPVMPPPAPPAVLQAPPPPPANDATGGEQVAPGPRAEAQTAPRAHELPVLLPLSEQDAALLGKGEGLLEVVAGRSDEIYVGHQLIGKGPSVKVPLPARAEPHEVRVKLRGEERVRYVVVQEGKRIRLRVAPPWTR
ncbi:MAG: hypothetical protein DRI90_07625 [Deltaproteobacteria bacterium]|nr:MAG: hypothetical protein DRI90_07625 [Deltaproteobacteria bacterium]